MAVRSFRQNRYEAESTPTNASPKLVDVEQRQERGVKLQSVSAAGRFAVSRRAAIASPQTAGLELFQPR